MTWQPMLGFRAGGVDLEDPAHYRDVLAGAAAFLPAFAYDSAVFARLEDEKIWTRAWVPMGAPARIPRAGDLLPHTVGEHGVHLRRLADGTVQGYFNFAQHGGCRFVPRQCQTGTKTHCFYTSCGHSRDRDVIPANPDGSEPPEMYMYVGINPLKQRPVRTAMAGPVAFVCLDPAESATGADAGDPPSVDGYLTGATIPVAHWTAEAGFNWKLAFTAAERLAEGGGVEALKAMPPNLITWRQGDAVVLVIAQPVGPAQTMLHVDVLSGEPAREGDTAVDAVRAVIGSLADTAVSLQSEVGTGRSCHARHLPLTSAFQQWLVARVLVRHVYPDRPLYAMPGRASNSGVNAGPF